MTDIDRSYKPLKYAYSEKARIDLSLPEFVDISKIGVNISTIERLCKLGGISHLRVANQKDAETSQFTPAIVGYANDGSAYASKVGVETKVPTHSTSSQLDMDWLEDELPITMPFSCIWTKGNIDINIDEISHRISDDKKWEGVRDGKAWSFYLDQAIKKGVTGIGIKHLTYGAGAWKKADGAVATAAGVLDAADISPLNFLFGSFNPHIPTIESSIFEILYYHQVFNFFDYLGYRNKPHPGYRWSLFHGPQFDRALALKVISPRVNIVKDFSKS